MADVSQVTQFQLADDQELALQLLADQELALQLLADHELALQLLADQVLALQLLALQLLALHELADQLLALQELALQLLAVHALPFHVPPDQLDADAVRGAMTLLSKAWPKMSMSPVSVTPLCTRWRVPRALSSEPAPSDHMTPPMENAEVGIDAFKAVVRLSSPGPWTSLLSFKRCVAVAAKRFFSSCGVIVGRCWMTSAAAPAATAAAWEVPLPRKKRVP